MDLKRYMECYCFNDKAVKKSNRGPPASASLRIGDSKTLTESASFSVASVVRRRYEGTMVQAVLAGGMVDLYAGVVRAGELMKRYPGLYAARPEVFTTHPVDTALVHSTEKLYPGEKLFMVPRSTVERIREREQRRAKRLLAASKCPSTNDVMALCPAEEETRPEREAGSNSGSDEEKQVWAKDFYVSRERWNSCIKKRIAKEEAEKRQQEKPKEKVEKKHQSQQHQQQRKRKARLRPPGRTSSRQQQRRQWKPALASVEELSTPSKSTE